MPNQTFKHLALPGLMLLILSAVAQAQPAITQQPVNLVVTNGGTAVFNVTATGSGPLAYQWLLNGIPLPPIITTIAGNGTFGFAGDGGAGTNGSLYYPLGVAVDGIGNVFIADNENSRVRKVDANGIITTVAGHVLIPIRSNNFCIGHKPALLAIFTD
jgi:hypothetical protein